MILILCKNRLFLPGSRRLLICSFWLLFGKRGLHFSLVQRRFEEIEQNGIPVTLPGYDNK